MANVDLNKEFIVEDIHKMDEFRHDEPKKKKKNPYLKFIVYFTLVIVFTGLALFLSLKDNFGAVVDSIKTSNVWYLLLILGLVCVCYFLEGLVILLFGRLYTRRYHYKHGVAASLVGTFYDSVTPGATGGQFMQVMTIKKQGIDVSNATSIVVMYVIIRQFAMIVVDLLAVIFQWKLLQSIGSFHISFANKNFDIPAIPLTIIGFVYNVVFTFGLIFLSYWKGFHNFVMKVGIGFLAKIKIVKKPDEMRGRVKIAVENFRIELKRLFSNKAVFIFTFIVATLILIVKYSLPYFAGLALNGYGISEITGEATTGQVGAKSFWDSVFLSSYHQMTSCLIPLPGSAGISEIFFNIIFETYFINPSITTAAQIIWRSATYYIVLLFSGIFSAIYSASPKGEEASRLSRKEFHTIQYETLLERQNGLLIKRGGAYDLSDFDEEIHKRKKPRRNRKESIPEDKPKKEIKPTKQPEIKDNKKEDDKDEWEEIVI